ncbi:MAG: septum formation initiator family protein [Deltaproteobacteria bacterium]|nr:septum formation initiator family protein [Deltaproteobacteria bacterium]MBW1924250.1 septum formation initiator family protein [Deltaproteobacteria bacterium]MBW1949223.1 septum formation initiator family protein [Deltaproteobacteria bacterium]MBW2007198.1 septum formation initiator family protein [Deltaproteobacteria bacterium]MBW2346533.1 septum formation initiator family protein [Deltaproteobacteria bacterium]
MRPLFKYSLIGLCIFGPVVAWLGFGERGFVHLYRLEKERRLHIEKIRRLQEENQALLKEIERLRNDPAYAEAVARRELGMVKDNEMIYRFPGGAPGPPEAHRRGHGGRRRPGGRDENP